MSTAQAIPGQTAGYLVLKADRFGNWHETNAAMMDTIGQGVAMVRRYQDDDPTSTYAVGKVTLSMISRPDELMPSPMVPLGDGLYRVPLSRSAVTGRYRKPLALGDLPSSEELTADLTQPKTGRIE